MKQGVTSHLLVRSSLVLTKSVCISLFWLAFILFSSLNSPTFLAITPLPKRGVVFLVLFCFFSAGFGVDVTFSVDSIVLQSSFSQFEFASLVTCMWPFWSLGSQRQQPFAAREAVLFVLL